MGDLNSTVPGRTRVGYADAVREVLQQLLRNRGVLVATTRVEVEQRYSGSIIGPIWVVVYPLLLLAVYLFLYLVIFRIRLPGFSQLDYVLYIFTGLVPYLAFMEAASTGATSVKQNLHLVRNVILPVELIPARAVGLALLTQSVGLVVVSVLAVINGTFTVQVLMLPVAIAVQVLFLLGCAYALAPLGVMLSDISHVLGIVLLFLLFISPIGFRPDALPGGMGFVVWANPIHYILAPFRYALLGQQSSVTWWEMGLGVVVGAAALAGGAHFFARFKEHLLDLD